MKNCSSILHTLIKVEKKEGGGGGERERRISIYPLQRNTMYRLGEGKSSVFIKDIA